MKKEEIKEDDWANNLIKKANINPDKLNEEGKRNLASEIVEGMPIKKLNKFLKEYGYVK